MKVVGLKKIVKRASCQALDARIDNGYVKNAHGSLP